MLSVLGTLWPVEAGTGWRCQLCWRCCLCLDILPLAGGWHCLEMLALTGDAASGWSAGSDGTFLL